MAGSDAHPVLRQLARAAGVADVYAAAGSTRHAPETTLRAVLTELGHECGDDAAARRSLRAVRRRRWRQPVDPVAVVWRAAGAQPTSVCISAPDDVTPRLALVLEDGTDRRLSEPVWGGAAMTDDGMRRRGSVRLPEDLPLGYHRLTIEDGRRTGACTVIVAPDRAPAIADGRHWGWMLQAYAVRSEVSWGQGEFADLATLSDWAAADGADFLLVNPVHAAAPVHPQQPSPYSPTSRRFVNPCYLHVPDVEGFDRLDAEQRRRWEDLPAGLAPTAARIDRDAVWHRKRAALWLLYERRDAGTRTQLDGFRTRRGEGLQRFATFCALAEEHGLPCGTWPEALQDPRSDAVTAWADRHDDLVGFHAWLQLQCTRQLRAAQDRARRAGMAIGIIHDLPVGVAPGGADVWSLPGEFARSMGVGAPPDAFNQHGQSWGQPPPLPAAMRASGYRTQRDVLSAMLTAGGGLRIDHILGFSRLFWIPHDTSPADGTYVRYPADELFAVLVLEAHRADAIVIGEDLGTVDDRIRSLLRRRGVAGSAVLWFEHDDTTSHGRRAAEAYPRTALASITTHDLPTATGWWDGSDLRLRADLGLLTESREAAEQRLADDHASLLALLRSGGHLDDGADVRGRVVAMHRFLASSRSALVAAALWDGIGDPRPPNVPGTIDAYPNWRLPLALPGPDGARPVTVEDLVSTPLTDDVVSAIRSHRD